VSGTRTNATTVPGGVAVHGAACRAPQSRPSTLARVRVFLVRHAKAASGEPDAMRPLTAEGRDAAHRLGEELGTVGLDAVVTSPLLRARQTGEAIAAVAGVDVTTNSQLSPGATLDDVREAVAGRGDTVAVVGHQPDLSGVVHSLTGEVVPFATGSYCEVDL
jgi:phosphohistidine phosphatase